MSISLPIISDVIKAVAEPILGIIDKAVPDKTQAAQLKNQIQNALINFDTTLLESRAKAIVAEASGESWLQRNWRPLTMLSFTCLIVAHWLGHTAPNLSEAQILSLLGIVKVGLGGYVLGRSAEKVAKNWKPNS